MAQPNRKVPLMHNLEEVTRVVSVEVPALVPEGKMFTLTLRGDELAIQAPVSFRTPKVSVGAMDRALSELRGGERSG